jgi:hypothetical protein
VELWADLKAHKTVAHQNNAEVLQAVIDEVHVQLARWRSPGMLGVASVATVWQQGWHLRKAKWDAAAFAASETLVAEALEAERTPQALYAHAQLNGAACRLMPSSPDRVVRCAYAQAAFEVLFESYEGRPGAEGWFIVESRWAAESLEKVDLIRALQAVEEKWVDAREDEGVQAAAALALAHCDQARAFLDDAPVNARFLAGDCVRVAGWSGDLRRYLEWVDVYVDQALAVGSKGKELNKRSAAIVFAGGLPECREAVRLTGDAQDWSVKLVDDSPAGFGDLCAYLGYRAIGCETRGNAHKHYDDLSLGPIVLKRQLKPQGLPWSEVQTALNKHGAAGTCPL